ncbi:20614_t:CDS:2 [Rhizophagus irregularis]|nr:20614_t:CDS:2 [Rhizophagus irregularis]
MGIYSFIAGMFQSILRMKFEQFTTSPTHRTFDNVIHENNDNRSRSTTVWIPKGYQVTITFWTLIILLLSLTTTSSIMMGLNRNIVRENNAYMKHNKAFLYANGFLHGTFWFNCTLVIVILIYHGRNLVRMVKESFALTGIQDARNRNVSDRIKRRLENAKVAFEAFSASLIPIVVTYEKLFSALWIGLLFTAISNFLTPICLIAVLIGILKA